MTGAWLTFDEAAEHLAVSRELLRLHVKADLSAPFVDVGTGKNIVWRVEAAKLDDWWRERCRRSASTAENTASSGATPAAARGPRSTTPLPSGAAAPSASPKSGTAKSKMILPQADHGRPVSLVSRLPSRAR